jgi:hypothetical protein
MTQEQLRMQMLAGIITESQYKSQLSERAYHLRILMMLTLMKYAELGNERS